MQDLGASSGKVADCNQANIPRVIRPFQACSGASVAVKGSILRQCLVCPFWANVEQWQCNTADPMDPNNSYFLVDYTLTKTCL